MALKIVTILGTRPEIIRLSCTLSALDTAFDHTLIHTGQNYDANLNDIFFDDLSLRKPDHKLNAVGASRGETIGNIITKSESLLKELKPDGVVILGDTDSAMSAIPAKQLGIPIFHMEAGNRSFNEDVPEEINRRIVDHIAHYNLVYTEHARRNLLAEGLPTDKIFLTGSPIREVLNRYSKQIGNSPILKKLKLKKQKYFLASLHRAENVDDPNTLAQHLQGWDALANKYQLPIVVSTHPRTRKKMEDNNLNVSSDLIHFHEPMGFFDYCHLQKNAHCVISDSGTISEESAMMGFAAVCPRPAIERPEALEAGTIVLCGSSPESLLGTVKQAVSSFSPDRTIPTDYHITNTSERAVNIIRSQLKF